MDISNTKRRTRSCSNSNVIGMCKAIRKYSRESDQDSSSYGGHSTQKKRYVKVWTPEEDRLLDYYYQQCHGNWKSVAESIAGRNPSQCAQRWKRINPQRNKLRRQWTEEEDYQVVRLVGKFGKNWKKIEEEMQGRSGKQIRERWINKLDPTINHEKFTEAEDRLILQQFQEQGAKWSEISKLLKGRPENMVKNRFYSYIRRTYLNDDTSVKKESESLESEEEEEEQQQHQQLQLQPEIRKTNSSRSINLINHESPTIQQPSYKNLLTTIYSTKEDCDSIPPGRRSDFMMVESDINIGAYNRPSIKGMEFDLEPNMLNSNESIRLMNLGGTSLGFRGYKPNTLGQGSMSFEEPGVFTPVQRNNLFTLGLTFDCNQVPMPHSEIEYELNLNNNYEDLNKLNYGMGSLTLHQDNGQI